MNIKTIELECAGCRKNYLLDDRDRDGEGAINLPTENCEFCEGDFCAGRCFRAHDCPGHDAEIVICVSCEAECELSKNKLGHVTRPAMIEGDVVCAKCAYLKPWEKKKPTEVKVAAVRYFDKAI